MYGESTIMGRVFSKKKQTKAGMILHEWNIALRQLDYFLKFDGIYENTLFPGQTMYIGLDVPRGSVQRAQVFYVFYPPRQTSS